MTDKIDIEARKEMALFLFNEGYNCSQSVFCAYSDLFELDPELARRLTSSFGGGMGRLREVCGAVSSMFLLLGLHYPASDPTDKAAKTANYASVQRTAEVFKSRFGSLICRELLDVKRVKESPVPSDRTAEYYAKRPCARFVVAAAEIIGRELQQSAQEAASK
jgi:C_GCAxxG_C_C family probable redox protein